jgi:hypothetical protein
MIHPPQIAGGLFFPDESGKNKNVQKDSLVSLDVAILCGFNCRLYHQLNRYPAQRAPRPIAW